MDVDYYYYYFFTVKETGKEQNKKSENNNEKESATRENKECKNMYMINELAEGRDRHDCRQTR